MMKLEVQDASGYESGVTGTQFYEYKKRIKT
jgi:hypothetical protein